MAAQQLTSVLRRLALAAGRPVPGVTDAELLRRFAASCDESAFATLVQRHGGLVLGVCRRVLRHEQDAEDAFQATFLLLARKPSAVRRLDSLAGWLHAAARLTALNARKLAMRRRKYEGSVTEAPPAAAPSTVAGLKELQAVLDDELQRLPERYRAAFVLCCLEGLSRPEAAAELRLNEGTVSSRLARGRRLLQDRLTRRGVALSAALCANALSGQASGAAVPAALADSAVRVAGLGAAKAALPPHLVSLTEGALGAMSWTKLKCAIAVLFVLGTVAAGSGVQRDEPPAPTGARAKADPTPLPQRKSEADEGRADSIDLAGTWKVKLPAGVERKVTFTDLGDNRFKLTPAGLTFAGVYEFKKGRLVLAKPSDPRLAGFEWEVRTDGTLKLVAQPDTSIVGSNYIGAVLTRLGEDDAKEPARPARVATNLVRTAANPAPNPADRASAVEAPAGTCRVTGSLASTQYAKTGGTLDRAVVSVLTERGRKRVVHLASKTAAFTLDLAPGDYVLECTGVGSRGATFEPTDRPFTVKPGEATLDLGVVDLRASKVTKLFGKPAPELGGVVAWKNTDPVTVKGLKGKVVVLDFWSYSCSICLHHMPDLAKLAEKYKGAGLEVLAVHDSSAETIADMNGKLPDAQKRKLGDLPVALDGPGAKGVFRSYGIQAVPAVVVIDRDGKVVRRFHHAGDPELDAELARLLRAK